jgi:hypothetical protein
LDFIVRPNKIETEIKFGNAEDVIIDINMAKYNKKNKRQRRQNTRRMEQMAYK